jgi:ribosome-associated heat shock protein Hsp15
MIYKDRIDKSLSHVRLAPSRARAGRLIEEGHVRINGRKTEKAHHPIRPGDVLTIALPAGVRVVRVLALSQRRMGSNVARGFYLDLASG